MSTRPAVAEPEKRPRRLGLFLPFVLLLLALAGWTAWWFTVARRVEAETDRAAVSLRQAGYEVAWADRRVEGWPFRTLVRFRDFSVAAPSGHALAAPRLDAEANTYDIGRWVAVAPDGIAVTRGDKGVVDIKGKAIRASLSGAARTPPNLAIELAQPVFTPRPGAEPFPLASAEVVDLYLRPKEGAPAGTGEFLFRVTGGKPRPDGMLDWIGRGEPFSTRWEGVVSGLDRFAGAGWSPAARAWAAGGGALAAVRGTAKAGSASLDASAAQLIAGPDGRLLGVVDLTLKGGPESLMSLGRSGAVDARGAAAAAAATAVAGGLDGTARVRVEFTPEGSRIGPVRLSDSPRVY